MNTGKILIGLLAGAAAGAALGVLLAPDNGSKTIKRMTESKENYSEAVKEKIVNFLFSLIDKITSEKSKAAEANTAS